MEAITHTILIVDDDAMYRELAARTLRRHRYRVIEANNWVEANRALREPVDLVLLDLHMRSVDGDQIAPVIRKHHPDIRLLLISADDTHVLQRLTRDDTFDGYVSKNGGLKLLVESVQQALTPGKAG
ncbi:MAG: response regulator [Candidatus Dadabacteria bacterium]|nr:MAG: response regulator [Candidatus Dadabacteria bacterium]